MCGRYSLALSNEEVYDALENQLPRMFNHGGRRRWERPQDYRPKRVTLNLSRSQHTHETVQLQYGTPSTSSGDSARSRVGRTDDRDYVSDSGRLSL